ncbi:response regulator [Sphingobacterium sp. ML3W]|uniref:response regulator n=1 Tax=Sphingobacterium sp. ML3W TaxID=1538644 RepID=UPI003009FB3C
MVLEHLVYHVEASETSHNVIERVEEIQPDLILMDNWIPKIGGVKATQRLKLLLASYKDSCPIICAALKNSIYTSTHQSPET